MKLLYLAILLICCLNCSHQPYKPTIGQELCQSGCKMLGGNYVNMTEADRKCYCVFSMPERLTLPESSRRQEGTNSSYAQAN